MTGLTGRGKIGLSAVGAGRCTLVYKKCRSAETRPMCIRTPKTRT